MQPVGRRPEQGLGGRWVVVGFEEPKKPPIFAVALDVTGVDDGRNPADIAVAAAGEK